MISVLGEKFIFSGPLGQQNLFNKTVMLIMMQKVHKPLVILVLYWTRRVFVMNFSVQLARPGKDCESLTLQVKSGDLSWKRRGKLV